MSSTLVVSAMMTPAKSPLPCDKLRWLEVALEAAEVTKEAGVNITDGSPSLAGRGSTSSLLLVVALLSWVWLPTFFDDTYT